MTSLFAVIGHDNPGADSIRTEHLQAHLAHIGTHIDQLALAGPMNDAQGKVCGSLLVVKAMDAAEARRFIEQDPYFAAGVWARIEVLAFRAVAGDWVGGATWARKPEG